MMRRFMLAAIALLLAARIEAATVLIFSEPTGATVTIGEDVKGKTPLRLSLKIGDYDLKLTKKGYDELSESVTVGEKLIQLRLNLKVNTYPVDILFKDIKAQQDGWEVFGTKPLTYMGTIPGTLKLPAGKFNLVLVKEGFRDIRKSIAVTGESQVVELDAPESGSSSLSRLIRCKWIGEWVKVEDSRVAVTLTLDKFKFVAPWANWEGKWEATAVGMSMEDDQKFVLKLTEQPNGELHGPSRTGGTWKLRRKAN